MPGKDRTKKSLFLGASMLLVAQTAGAHVPYLLPMTFDATKDYVTVQAAMTEDNYFVPDIPMRAADYYIINPSGTRSKLDKLTTLKEFTAIEAQLPEKGTYKITSGEEGGRKIKMAKIDGQWRVVRPAKAASSKEAAPMAKSEHDHKDEQVGDRPAAVKVATATPKPIDESALPSGVELFEVQTVLKSEVYVSRGAPTSEALKTTGHGFEVKPITHPNEIYVDQGFSVDVLAEGQPVKDLAYSVYRGGNNYDEKKIIAEGKTDAKGRIALTFDRPGVYLLKTRYPATPREPRTETPAPKTYTYSLTFEVMR